MIHARSTTPLSLATRTCLLIWISGAGHDKRFEHESRDYPICLSNSPTAPVDGARGSQRFTFVDTIRSPSGRRLGVETLTTGLDVPWDLVWGPDKNVWFTERSGRISRLDPKSGRVHEIGSVDIAGVRWTGLMGLAIHPDFKNRPFVFLMHSYNVQNTTVNRVVRFTMGHGKLVAPKVILDGIPSKGNHNGGRIAFGGDGLLYVTTGDAGVPRQAQDVQSLAGKILRLTSEGEPAPNNPLGGFVWSFGHRNPQGLVFARESNLLFSTEHGPWASDEINIIERGSNYGWPNVVGKCDTSAERAECSGMVDPLVEISPTIGIAGIAIFESTSISEWNGNLMVVSLVGETLSRLVFDKRTRAVTAQENLLDHAYGRLRSILVSPEGDVYVATSNRDERGKAGPCDDRIIRIRPI